MAFRWKVAGCRFGKAVEAAGARAGDAARNAHTKAVTGGIPLDEVAGWWQYGHQPGRYDGEPAVNRGLMGT